MPNGEIPTLSVGFNAWTSRYIRSTNRSTFWRRQSASVRPVPLRAYVALSGNAIVRLAASVSGYG